MSAKSLPGAHITGWIPDAGELDFACDPTAALKERWRLDRWRGNAAPFVRTIFKS